jgi:hypothetical protein
VFVLYGLLAGLVLGKATGGRARHLLGVQLAWPWLAAGGLLLQVGLFSSPVTAVVGDAGPPLYVVSIIAVLAFVLRNAGSLSVSIIAVGALSNLAAILANGGYMPVSAAALQALGRVAPVTYSNSRVVLHPALEPLTDFIALPRGMPFANVISVGDVLIAVGLAAAVAHLMKDRREVDNESPPGQRIESAGPVTDGNSP